MTNQINMECTKVVGLMNSERRHSRNLLLKLTAKREKQPIIKKKKGHPQLYISVLNTKTSWGGAMEKSKKII
jgi:hypothetical protein